MLIERSHLDEPESIKTEINAMRATLKTRLQASGGEALMQRIKSYLASNAGILTELETAMGRIIRHRQDVGHWEQRQKILKDSFDYLSTVTLTKLRSDFYKEVEKIACAMATINAHVRATQATLDLNRDALMSASR